MAANRKGSGKTIEIASASGTIVSGIPVVQEGWFGIALGSAASGSPLEIAIEGRWNIAVPASTVKGDILYIPGGAAGVSITEDNDCVANFTRTPATTSVAVVKAMTDRDTAGYSDVLILPAGATRATQQA